MQSRVFVRIFDTQRFHDFFNVFTENQKDEFDCYSSYYHVVFIILKCFRQWALVPNLSLYLEIDNIFFSEDRVSISL